jgi:site-specific DNA-methyltransferase (adenine-specific)
MQIVEKELKELKPYETLIACEQLNRTAYLMEYEPKYLDVIIDRYERLTGDRAELIEE